MIYHYNDITAVYVEITLKKNINFFAMASDTIVDNSVKINVYFLALIVILKN